MLKISIIIPIFNGLSFTKECLKNFYKTSNGIENNELEYSVVIVDDGSTDGSADWIRENYPQVVVLKGNGSLWWSGGINLALRHALNVLNADFILWWNNDIVAIENYFTELSKILIENDGNLIIGSKVYSSPDQKTVWSMGGIFNPVSGYKDMIGRGQADSDEFSVITENDWLPGMGSVTHKSVYEKIGFLDDANFPQYHGDCDFTFRAKMNGFRILTYPNLKIFNNTENSGLKHNDSFKMLFQSLFSIKSNFNIRKDFLFYRKHAQSVFVYKVLLNKYFKYIGGFIKWKILGLFGLQRK
jgi:GT2 family glycosyltransferase